MKKILLSFFIISLLASCSNRLGDLNLVSNRNFDKNQNYVLLQRDVEAKVKTKKNDAIEVAIDKATSSVIGGEYMQNVQIWVSWTGHKLKLKGDVWGLK